MQYITRNPDVDKYLLFGMLNYEQLSMLNCVNRYLNRNIHKHITKFKDFGGGPSETMMAHHNGIRRSPFTTACIAGNLSVAKKAMNIMIHDAVKFSERDSLQYLFTYKVCGNGFLDVAKWLFRIDNTLIGNNAFSSAFYSGHLNVFLWLYEQSPKQIVCEHYFALGCGRFELSQMQLYYKVAKIDVCSVGNRAFNVACGRGKLHVAEWLWDISNEQINIHTDNEHAFICACTNGHLDVAQWLWKISNKSIEISADDHSAFEGACGNQRNDVAEWLCTLSDRYSITTITKIVANVKN